VTSHDRARRGTPVDKRIIADAIEDPTSADIPAVEPRKFASPDELRTEVVPNRGRRLTPPGGAVEERVTARLPTAGPKTGVVGALAASATSITITEPSLPVVTTSELPAVTLTDNPIVTERPRTQIWVATHKMPEDPDERLILVHDPDSTRAASFRVLRHRLQEHGDPRIIAVTSARAREGKTTCAANLALALGECGRARVLLVEANLRTPALASLFGFMPPECFVAQLSRHRERPEDGWSVVEVLAASLHVLAVKPEEPARPLLDGPAFRIAIDMLSQAGYDYIVIDTPPVLGAADVNLVEDSAEGVLFVAQARQTPGRLLRQAVEQLAPGKLIGVALLDA
jgi:Mrp family chromosome partitioning ATPase